MTTRDVAKKSEPLAKTKELNGSGSLGGHRREVDIRRNAIIPTILCAIGMSLYCLPAAAIDCRLAKTEAETAVCSDRAEMRKMTAAGIRLQKGYEEYTWKRLAGLKHGSPAYNEVGELATDCSWFIYARFYSRFRNIIDKLDTSPFRHARDFEQGDDLSIIRDPKKIVVSTRDRILDIWYLKKASGSAWDFAVEYARNPELENKCQGYLDAAGLR